MKLTLSRCPAPTGTDFGVLRCIVTDDRCTEPTHTKWRHIAWPMAVLWRVKPWWPNAKGRLADAGVQVCKRCGCTETRACDPPCWWVEKFLCSSCEVRP